VRLVAASLSSRIFEDDLMLLMFHFKLDAQMVDDFCGQSSKEITLSYRVSCNNVLDMSCVCVH
jgi:hypothetical protein